MILRDKIDKYFADYPVQKEIAYLILKYGLKIKGNKIYCGDIEQSSSKLARAISINYRSVAETIKRINSNAEMRDFFSSIEPTPNLKNVARKIGLGVIELIPEDPHLPGIISGVSSIIANEDISIRQAISDDYEFAEGPRLVIITDPPIPDKLISKIKGIRGIKGVTIY